jgi:hypothetical protein
MGNPSRMNAASQSNSPTHEYQSRRDAYQTEQKVLEKRANNIGNYRGLSALLFFAILVVEQNTDNPVLPVILVGFLALVLWHRKVKKNLVLCKKRIQYYQGGLERLQGEWQQQPSGSNNKDKSHPYTDALDIFGPHSLFQLLCTATTESGKHTLASWLKKAAATEEILARQGAVAELKPQVSFRESLYLIGKDIKDELHPKSLEAWGKARPGLDAGASKTVAVFVVLLTIAFLASLPLALMDITVTPLLICFVLQVLVRLGMNNYITQTMEPLFEKNQALTIVSALIEHVENNEFHDKKLQALKTALAVDNTPAAQKIKQLANLSEWFYAEKNQLFLPIAIVLGWGPLFALRINHWRTQCGSKITLWLDSVGEVEALLALANFAYENPQGHFPQFVDDPKGLSGRQLSHPLLAAHKPVCNDIRLDEQRQILVVSGSNMSGKSTYLRTVGVNVVLAQTGSVVLADALRLSPVWLGATMDVQDSIQEGKSRFYAEISKIKSIIDLTDQAQQAGARVLFLLDELLHGTNSIDRKKGAELIIDAFLDKAAFGMITTHDLVLTQSHQTVIHNVHFTDEFDGEQLQFDYCLREGVVTHSNAMQIIKNLGIGPQ